MRSSECARGKTTLADQFHRIRKTNVCAPSEHNQSICFFNAPQFEYRTNRNETEQRKTIVDRRKSEEREKKNGEQLHVTSHLLSMKSNNNIIMAMIIYTLETVIKNNEQFYSNNNARTVSIRCERQVEWEKTTTTIKECLSAAGKIKSIEQWKFTINKFSTRDTILDSSTGGSSSDNVARWQHFVAVRLWLKCFGKYYIGDERTAKKKWIRSRGLSPAAQSDAVESNQCATCVVFALSPFAERPQNSIPIRYDSISELQTFKERSKKKTLKNIFRIDKIKSKFIATRHTRNKWRKKKP